MAKKKYTQEACLPLQLLRDINELYPWAWEDMARFHCMNGREGLPSWPDWCYVPMDGATAIVMEGTPKDSAPIEGMIAIVQAVAALAPWRLSKEIYVIDPEMQELLFGQADDLRLDPEILLHLPCQCFYIQFGTPLRVSGDDYDGVFVHLESDVHTEDRELRLLYLQDRDGFCVPFGLPIHLDYETIEEGLQHTDEEAYRNIENELPDKKEKIRRIQIGAENREEFVLALKCTLQIVLYLCAQNAEVEPDPKQRPRPQRKDDIKDRYSEVHKWNVGVRIGSAVRAYKKSEAQSSVKGKTSGTHASLRPHMRRGHWHNFWMGPRNDPTQRRLVLKWVAPTFINIAFGEDAPVTIHHVELN